MRCLFCLSYPIVELDNDNDININLDGDDMEMEGIDGPLSEAGTGGESVGTLARKPGNRKRKLTSHVWAFFEIFVGKDNKERDKCKKCGAIYLSASSHGTGDPNVEDVVESAIEELGEELSLLDVGQFSHRVNDVEESPESVSNGGNGPSGSGV
ncbi:hypothetical protein GIB67_012527 [Kingdonia uniflora]|uniref:BED-type domain-containing protein n=1 Tax=Kingdonia uniflora TaxID=39325 RepID=A0A7J7N5A1_9MAGN|nr:hypothetical protein GIB67_012527 [Kingdonia uniflora]